MLLQIAFATLLLVNVASAGTWSNWGSWSATCGDVVRTRTCPSAPCEGNGTETNALTACSPGARITACGSSTPVYTLSPDSDNCGNLACSPALSSPPAVVNGMPCRCFSRCYGGQCIPTECFRQNILDANGVVDACGVCNGDNSTCTRTITEAPEGSIVMNAAISVTFYFTWPATDAYFVILDGSTQVFSTETTTQSQWEAANGEFSFTVSGHTSIVTYSGPIAAEACGTRGFVKITNPQSGYNFILVNPHSSTGTPLTAVEITAYTTSTTTTTTTTTTMTTTTALPTSAPSSGGGSSSVVIGAAVGGAVGAAVIITLLVLKFSPQRFQRIRRTGPTESVNPLFSKQEASNNYAAAYAAPPSQYADSDGVGA